MGWSGAQRALMPMGLASLSSAGFTWSAAAAAVSFFPMRDRVKFPSTVEGGTAASGSMAGIRVESSRKTGGRYAMLNFPSTSLTVKFLSPRVIGALASSEILLPNMTLCAVTVASAAARVASTLSSLARQSFHPMSSRKSRTVPVATRGLGRNPSSSIANEVSTPVAGISMPKRFAA